MLAPRKWNKPFNDNLLLQHMKRLITLLMLPLYCQAEDFTLADGTVLKDAEVLRKDGEVLQIRHAGGIEKFSYTELGETLQLRYDLTPAQVEARRAAAAEAAAEKQRAKEAAKAEKERLMKEEQEARQATLDAAGKHARYICGAEVIQLCSSMFTLDARAAEFLAAEWNRREALRLNLPVDTQRFSAEAASLKPDFEKERGELAAVRSELSDKRAEVQEQAATIKRQEAEIAALRAEVAKLNKELGRAENNRPTTTTVVVDNPVYVPTYVGPTCVGHVHRPRPHTHHAHKPRPARPAARPKPVQVSPGPRPASAARPANSAHTLPRSR